jgi:transposase
MTCPEVARWLGGWSAVGAVLGTSFPTARTRWTDGGRTRGPARRLNEKQIQEIDRVLRPKPSDAAMRVNLWDGKTLSAWIDKTYGIELRVRQCQCLFRQLGFRLRKPRPVLARADPARQKAHKKDSDKS